MRYLTSSASTSLVTNSALTVDAWEGLGAVTAEQESEWVKDGGIEVQKKLEEEEEELIECKVMSERLICFFFHRLLGIREILFIYLFIYIYNKLVKGTATYLNLKAWMSYEQRVICSLTGSSTTVVWGKTNLPRGNARHPHQNLWESCKQCFWLIDSCVDSCFHIEPFLVEALHMAA